MSRPPPALSEIAYVIGTQSGGLKPNPESIYTPKPEKLYPLINWSTYVSLTAVFAVRAITDPIDMLHNRCIHATVKLGL